jgi:hypothetical protein
VVRRDSKKLTLDGKRLPSSARSVLKRQGLSRLVSKHPLPQRSANRTKLLVRKNNRMARGSLLEHAPRRNKIREDDSGLAHDGDGESGECARDPVDPSLAGGQGHAGSYCGKFKLRIYNALSCLCTPRISLVKQPGRLYCNVNRLSSVPTDKSGEFGGLPFSISGLPSHTPFTRPPVRSPVFSTTLASKINL